MADDQVPCDPFRGGTPVARKRGDGLSGRESGRTAGRFWRESFVARVMNGIVGAAVWRRRQLTRPMGAEERA
jgi:hypothetical protein